MQQRSIDEILRDSPAIVTGRQIRAARIFAKLSRLELANLAGIAEGTVITIEHFDGQPINCRLETRIYILDALWKSGVRLIDNEGIEKRS